jgi:hypothetical protein
MIRRLTLALQGNHPSCIFPRSAPLPELFVMLGRRDLAAFRRQVLGTDQNLVGFV